MGNTEEAWGQIIFSGGTDDIGREHKGITGRQVHKEGTIMGHGEGFRGHAGQKQSI